LIVPGPGGRRLILLAHDLGILLAMAPRVAVWDGEALRIIAARALGRTRRLHLRLNAGMGDALRAAGLEPRAPPSRPGAPGDVTLRQPIDCIVEGPVG